MVKHNQIYEYVFINDGSEDNGVNILYNIIKDENIKTTNLVKSDIYHTMHRGLGNALRYGFDNCSGQYIIVMDADLSYKPVDVEIMIRELKKQPYLKCISASPYYYGLSSKIVGSSPLRIFGSLLFNKIHSVILKQNITCATGMFRLYHRNTLKSFALKSEGYDINAEIITEFLLRRESFIEIPSVLYVRTVGQSKMRVGIEIFREMKLISKTLKRIIFH